MKKKINLFSIVTKKEIIVFVITFIISVLAVGVFFIGSKVLGIDFKILSKDTAAIFGAGGYYGAMSNMGITLWGISSMSFFLAWYSGKYSDVNREMVKLNLYFGLLSALLYFDDFFMLHEYFMIRIFHLPGFTLMIFYGICVLYLVIKYLRLFIKNGLIYIVSSFGFLGLSAVVDIIHDNYEFQNAHLYEDGFKFIGICFWMVFAIMFTSKQFRGKINIK